MKIGIVKPPGGGIIKAVASKSQAHRMLICAALSGSDTYIECGEESDDINATIGCLKSLGAGIRYDGGGYEVKPVDIPGSTDEIILQRCGDSGSTMRFMLPVCCALGVTAEFAMSPQLSKRPINSLTDQLSAHSCVFETRAYDPVVLGLGRAPSANTLLCSGQLTGGVFTLPGDISSQYISGLLFALPLLGGDSKINVTGRLESEPYVDMTVDTLDLFGVKVERETNDNGGLTYIVTGGQKYVSPGKTTVEGDWSNAAFWLCSAALGGSGVICSNLDRYSRQGDKEIVDILERFGAVVAYKSDSVAVRPSRLRSIRIDAANTPDLVPVLSVVAAAAQGQTVIYNAERLRLKESDRLRTTREALTALGADIIETSDGLIINGRPSLKGGTVSSCGDHRIAMMAAIASVVCEDTVAIRDAEAVNKSYPRFFEDFVKLGGEIVEGM